MEIIKQRFAEHIALAQQVAASSILEQVAASAAMIKKALKNGNKVLFCGNGGSAADSQHLAAEFVGRFQKERDGLAAIALTVDTSILTAVANDYGYDTVFARQVQALGNTGDVLVGLSTSGNSKNVLAAIEAEYAPGGQVDKLDGLSIDYSEWRFNVRVSNTEPVMRLNVETRGDKKLLAEKTAELLELIGGEEA